jgi:hypothetical protein
MDATNEDKQMSVYLHAFLASSDLMVVITKDAEQIKLIRRLFNHRDRTQIRSGHRWHVRSLARYRDIPLVRQAVRAYESQFQLDGKLPTCTKTTV